MKQRWNPAHQVPLRTRVRCAVFGHKDDLKRNDRKEVYWVCRRCGHFTDRAPGAEYAPGTLGTGDTMGSADGAM